MPETSTNPYIAGSPVTGPEMFFGREDVFKFVRQALTGQHRDHVLVLYGQRRTGKTSVLYQMSRQLGERYLCIFIDLHGLGISGLGGFLWELANHIARVLRRDYQIQLPVLDRATFLEEPRSAFENTFLDSVWDAIGERHLLLMLDEAVRLEEQVQAGKLEPQVFDYLRHLMQHYPRLNFLFSLGSGLEEMQKEYAFLFNVALYKKISFLDRASAEALITEPVKDICPVPADAVQRILEVTSGHPYFTQLVCHSLFNRCQGEAGVTGADVDAVLEEAVERGSAVLKHVWEDSTPGEKAALAALAAVPQPGQASLSMIMQTWAEREVTFPENEAARALRSLAARDVIAGGEEFAFSVGLMRLWVQKFRRLDWVKEEVEPSFQEWSRREQERLIKEEIVREKPPVVQQRPVQTITGRRAWTRWLVLPALVLVGLAFFLIRGLAEQETPSPTPMSQITLRPGVDEGAPTSVSSTLLGGEAARVSDLAVLGGYVWAATDGGLVRWSADGTYTLYPGSDYGLDSDCINTIATRTSDSTLWLGCGGVVVVRVQGNDVELLDYYDRDDGLGMGVVRAIEVDPDGLVWAGGVPDEDGDVPLRVFREDSGDKVWQPPERISQGALAAIASSKKVSVNINSMVISSERILLGLHDDGILWLEDGQALTNQDAEGVGGPGLVDRRIRQIFVDPSGTAWAAASDQGLLHRMPGSNTWETVDLGEGVVSISAVTGFADGSLWAAGDRLVLRSDDQGQTWLPVGEPQGLGVDIGSIVQDEDGNIWVGAYQGGVSVWERQRWRALQQ